jgi:hypothetical protein
MTDAELLVTGGLCAALLTSSDFTNIVGQYELTIAADLLATAPHETKKREHLYATLWGARGLLEFMKLNASAASAIKEPKPPMSTTDTDVTYDDEGFERADTRQIY